MLSHSLKNLLILLAFSLGLTSCTVSEADCNTDTDCPTNHYCATGGGILFSGGICIKKSPNASEDFLDTSDFFDTAAEHDTHPLNDTDHSLSDTDTNTAPETDADDHQTDQQCVLDTDCTSPEETEWTLCDGFENTCATTGTQTRQIHSSSCIDGFCIPKTTTTERNCTRETAGNSCGPANESEWTECNFDGIKTREVSAPTCQAETCTTITTTETLPCSCTTNASCGEATHGNWGDCVFENTCTTTGTQKREVKTPTCTNSSCEIVTTTQTQSCNRPSTTGTTCGAPTTAAWSACTNPTSNTCATTGTRTQQTHTPTCQNNTCTVVTTTATQNCPLTPPTTCGAETHSAWSTCSFPSTCASSGTQTRTKTTPTCQNGTCNSIQTTESQSCTRTVPTTCGSATYSAWSTCNFGNTCTNSGTQTRTKTTPTCQNGTCASINTTETQQCNRNTNGTPCGTSYISKQGQCLYPDECSNHANATTDTRTTPICQSGTCSGTQTTNESRQCNRNTNGTPCARNNICQHGCCGICP